MPRSSLVVFELDRITLQQEPTEVGSKMNVPIEEYQFSLTFCGKFKSQPYFSVVDADGSIILQKSNRSAIISLN